MKLKPKPSLAGPWQYIIFGPSLQNFCGRISQVQNFQTSSEVAQTTVNCQQPGQPFNIP